MLLRALLPPLGLTLVVATSGGAPARAAEGAVAEGAASTAAPTPTTTAPPPTPAPPSGLRRPIDVGALRFDVGTPRVVLGETEKVPLLITAKKKDGTPLDVAVPQLMVSTGSIGVAARVGPGRFSAVFTPPADRFPHVAIVSASIDAQGQTAVGFVSLHLWGKGNTTVRTKPESSVVVYIGNESFGPVTADAAGDAVVPIIVPPGPERAVAKSVDPLGNESQKTIDLGVPAFNRIALLPLDDVAAADGTGEALLLLFAVDKKGEPLFDARWKTSTTIGVLDEKPAGLAPGMFRLGLRPGTTRKGTASITVELLGAKGSAAQASVKLLEGKPVRADLLIEGNGKDDVLSSDAPREVRVEARLYDQGGNLVPSGAARYEVDYGRIDAIERTEAGTRILTWSVPAELVRTRATFTATLPDANNTPLGARTLTLLPGKPASLRFDPVPAVICDGQTAVEVRLRALDQAGNAVVPTGAELSVDAADGTLVAGTVDGTLYRARFVPVPRDRAGILTINGTLGALSTSVPVRAAPRPRAFLLLGAGLAASTNYGDIVAAGPDLSLLVRLPGFDGGVHAGFSLGLLQRVPGLSVDDPGLLDHRAYPVLVEAAWRPLLFDDLTFHLGGGVGALVADAQVGPEDNDRIVELAAAAHLVAGVGYRLGPGFLELDVRGAYAYPTVVTPPSPIGASVVLGYRFGI